MSKTATQRQIIGTPKMNDATTLATPPALLSGVPRKPGRMIIQGEGGKEKKSLESLLEEFAGIWEVSDTNRVHYRDLWKQYLPKYNREGVKETLLNPEWAVAYD